MFSESEEKCLKLVALSGASSPKPQGWIIHYLPEGVSVEKQKDK